MRDLNHDGQIYVTGKYTQSRSHGDSDSEQSSREPIRLGKCSRMRKAELQTFARQLGVLDFRVNGKVARKDQIWDKIFEKVGGGGRG